MGADRIGRFIEQTKIPEVGSVSVVIFTVHVY